MPIEQECKLCKRVFNLTKDQEKLYESKRAANQPLALGCPLCGRTWMMTFGQGKADKAHPQYRCPVSHCTGWVDYITAARAKSFYGCGACGSRWLNVENLYKVSVLTLFHRAFPELICEEGWTISRIGGGGGAGWNWLGEREKKSPDTRSEATGAGAKD